MEHYTEAEKTARKTVKTTRKASREAVEEAPQSVVSSVENLDYVLKNCEEQEGWKCNSLKMSGNAWNLRHLEVYK